MLQKIRFCRTCPQSCILSYIRVSNFSRLTDNQSKDSNVNTKILKLIHLNDQRLVEEYQYHSTPGNNTTVWRNISKTSRFYSPGTTTTTKLLQSPRLLLHYAIQSFYPKGYPDSVSPGYDRFMKNQMISVIFSSAGGILSMQSLLSAVGLGAGALPLSAILAWLLKDGLGQFGGIFFASLIHVKFDQYPKKWRWNASIALEISNSLEIATVFFPHLFLLFASLANIGKNISFLAASASRAAIHKSFAREENLADVTAKTGSQNIFSSMIGTSLGIWLVSNFGQTASSVPFATERTNQAIVEAVVENSGDPTMMIPALFISLSSLSLFFTYRALQSVTITSLNADRLDILIHHYFRIYHSLLPSSTPSSSDYSHTVRHVYNPTEIESHESLFGKYQWSRLDRKLFQQFPIIHYLDNQKVTLNDIFQTKEEFEGLISLFEHENYLINVSTNTNTRGRGKIFVMYKDGINAKEIIRASIHAYFLQRRLHELHYYSEQYALQRENDEASFETHMMLQRLDLVEESFHVMKDGSIEKFIQELFNSNAWQISSQMIDRSNIRIQF